MIHNATKKKHLQLQSAEENAFVAELAKGKQAWVGGSRVCKTCAQWVWQDGTTFSYTNWESGQPDNVGLNQDAMIINYGGKGRWDDRGANNHKHPFICKHM